MQVVKIRPLTSHDAQAFFQLVSDATIADLAMFPMVTTLTESNQRLANVIEHQQAIAIDLAQQMVGVIILSTQVMRDGMPDERNLEVAFMVNTAFQQRGIMGNALRLLLKQLTQLGRVDSLTANVQAFNRASKRVLISAGFTQVGTFLDFNGRIVCQFEIGIAN